MRFERKINNIDKTKYIFTPGFEKLSTALLVPSTLNSANISLIPQVTLIGVVG